MAYTEDVKVICGVWREDAITRSYRTGVAEQSIETICWAS